MKNNNVFIDPDIIDNERYPTVEKILTNTILILGIMLILWIGVGVPLLFLYHFQDFIINGFIINLIENYQTKLFIQILFIIVLSGGGWIAVYGAKSLFTTLRFYRTYNVPKKLSKFMAIIIRSTRIPILCNIIFTIYVLMFIIVYFIYGKEKY